MANTKYAFFGKINNTLLNIIELLRGKENTFLGPFCIERNERRQSNETYNLEDEDRLMTITI